MAKYNVGDKVLVIDNMRSYDGPYGSNSVMEALSGQIVTIKSAYITENGIYRGKEAYTIEEDDGMWTWANEMFAGKSAGVGKIVYAEKQAVEHNAINAINKADIIANMYSTLQLCEIYHPTDAGLNAVYDKWAEAKGKTDIWEGNSVLDILSKHPDYVPEKGYIVKRNEYDRGIDYAVISEVMSDLEYVLAHPTSNNIVSKINIRPWEWRECNAYADKYYAIEDALRVDPFMSYRGMTLKEVRLEKEKWRKRADLLYSQYEIINENCYDRNEICRITNIKVLIRSLREWVRDKINSMSETDLMQPLVIDDVVMNMIEKTGLGIRGVRAGQKFNKVVIKILTETGIKDKWVNFNKETARLGDASSPTKFTRFTVISANPLDYWRMSFGSSWSSCHTIDKVGYYRPSEGGDNYEGMHASGTSSYMGDPSSVVMYTVDKGYERRIRLRNATQD